MKTILITGANGQVGNEFRQLASNYPGLNFILMGREDLSIDIIDAVTQYFDEHKIDYCVNCAAYTAVDKAETEPEKAYEVNAIAVGNLAKACQAHQALFIHISTDYVLDGNATEPYEVNNPVNPVNLYGASKLKGEQLALENNPGTIIIRTSWVYAATGNNFVKTMLRLMSERESINVVSDQQGCPTYAADLAAAIMEIILQDAAKEPGRKTGTASNIYHYSNTGITNWFEFATAIKELSGKTCHVNPIASSQYPTPAKRPFYSVMDTSRIQEAFQLSIPSWRESLDKCIRQIYSNTAT